jgi:hypothetical protein
MASNGRPKTENGSIGLPASLSHAVSFTLVRSSRATISGWTRECLLPTAQNGAIVLPRAGAAFSEKQNRSLKTFADQNGSKKISTICDFNYTAFEGEFLSFASPSERLQTEKCPVRLASGLCQATQRKEKEPCIIESLFLLLRPSLSACRA